VIRKKTGPSTPKMPWKGERESGFDISIKKDRISAYREKKISNPHRQGKKRGEG